MEHSFSMAYIPIPTTLYTQKMTGFVFFFLIIFSTFNYCVPYFLHHNI